MSEIINDHGSKANQPIMADATGDLSETEKAPWAFAEPKEVEEGRTNPFGLVLIAGLFGLLWFGAGPRYFLVVVGLIVMIFLHELGHFMTARWTGMKATQFFLFMGPRLWSFRRGETEYGIRLIPAGAFVRIIGMHNLDPCDPEDEPRAYKNQSYPRRMLVITAGSIMHFIQAIVLFVVIVSMVGLQDDSKWSIGEISRLKTSETTPSLLAGLEIGDDILAIDGQDMAVWGDAVEYIQERPGEAVLLTVERDGSTFETSAELASVDRDDGSTIGYLGVGPTYERTRESPLLGFQLFGESVWQTLSFIPEFLNPVMFFELGQLMFEGQADVDVQDEEARRPISVVGAVRLAGQPDFDVTVPLGMLATINVFVGILNLLPLLPLDGGHALIATYERIRSTKERRYRADVAKALVPTYIVIAVLGFLFVSTLYLDLVRPISG